MIPSSIRGEAEETKPIRVHLIPCLADNYAFVLQSSHGSVIVIDPPEAKPVIEFFEANSIRHLDEIWITHHHADHVGGVAQLHAHFSCSVRGSDLELVDGSVAEPLSPHKSRARIAGITRSVDVESSWHMAESTVSVLKLPGHTRDHVAYQIRNDEQSLLFSGDVIFGMGCGRLFEGTPEQMLQSLNQIAALPNDTLIYCAHEYTERNLAFTLDYFASDDMGSWELMKQPNELREALQRRAERVNSKRSLGLPTVPLLLAEEIETNLFLLSLQEPNSLDCFKRLREARNHF
jgi:hydroxyacylglutathione hydrolase